MYQNKPRKEWTLDDYKDLLGRNYEKGHTIQDFKKISMKKLLEIKEGYCLENDTHGDHGIFIENGYTFVSEKLSRVKKEKYPIKKLNRNTKSIFYLYLLQNRNNFIPLEILYIIREFVEKIGISCKINTSYWEGDVESIDSTIEKLSYFYNTKLIASDVYTYDNWPENLNVYERKNSFYFLDKTFKFPISKCTYMIKGNRRCSRNSTKDSYCTVHAKMNNNNIIKKSVKKRVFNKNIKNTNTSVNKIFIEEYTAKSIVVRGDTFDHREE